MPTLRDAKIIFLFNGVPDRSKRLRDLKMHELRSGGNRDGWDIPFPDPALDLALVAHGRKRGTWILEGYLDGKLLKYTGAYVDGVFRVSEVRE